jgi:hypothetical protein
VSIEQRQRIACERDQGHGHQHKKGVFAVTGRGHETDHEGMAADVRYYILHSFAVRPDHLGAIETHPDYE